MLYTLVMRDNLLAADTFNDNAAEYLFIREQEAREEAAADAITLWQTEKDVRPVQYVPERPRF